MVLEDASEAIHAWTGERSVPLWAEPLAGESCSQCRERYTHTHAHTITYRVSVLVVQVVSESSTQLSALRAAFLLAVHGQVPRARAVPAQGEVGRRSLLLRMCGELHPAARLVPEAGAPASPGPAHEHTAGGGGSVGGRIRPTDPPSSTVSFRSPTSVADLSDDALLISIWELARKNTSCLTCERPCGKGHICRVCGSIYCSECSVKMKVPTAFRKKGKSNPVRVCCQCRFDLFGGAVLDPSEPPEGSGPVALVTSSTVDGAGACPGSGGSEPVSMKNDSKHFRSSPPPLPSYQPRLSGADSASSSGSISVVDTRIVSVSVQWHLDSTAPASSGGELLTVLKVNEDMALDQIYDRLLQQLPELADVSFGFLCRGKLVLRDFWDIFQAKHVRPVLYLVREQVLAASAPSVSQKSAHVEGGGGDGRVSFSSGSVEGAPSTEKQEVANGESACLERASALFSHEATRGDFLSFSRGDVVQLLIRKPGSKW